MAPFEMDVEVPFKQNAPSLKAKWPTRVDFRLRFDCTIHFYHCTTKIRHLSPVSLVCNGIAKPIGIIVMYIVIYHYGANILESVPRTNYRNSPNVPPSLKTINRTGTRRWRHALFFFCYFVDDWRENRLIDNKRAQKNVFSTDIGLHQQLLRLS